MTNRSLCWGILAAAGVVLAINSLAAAQEITFVKTELDNRFRSEGVTVADFNNDGKLDIACADVYFKAPDWQLVQLTAKPNVYEPNKYSVSFVNASDDLNGDGWMDLIVMGFPGEATIWYENPGEKGGYWDSHTIISETNNESPAYVDVDGDGVKDLVCSTRDKFVVCRRGENVREPWQVIEISTSMPARTQRYYHGLGIGDVNQDGHQDVIIPDGWFEAPAAMTSHEGPWTFHEVPLGKECSQMHVYDFDGDGDMDVISSSAHTAGVWWHEQQPDGWETHTIDESYTQTHSTAFADINGDGTPDLVTGKRWWAHNGGDPGANEPAVVYWYEVGLKDGQPTFTPHLVDENSGVGTQVVVQDVNGDGLLDIVSANKKGVHYLEQRRK